MRCLLIVFLVYVKSCTAFTFWCSSARLQRSHARTAGTGYCGAAATVFAILPAAPSRQLHERKDVTQRIFKCPKTCGVEMHMDKSQRQFISPDVFDEWVKVAWKGRDGYTFGEEELEVLGNASGKRAILLARKLLDKLPAVALLSGATGAAQRLVTAPLLAYFLLSRLFKLSVNRSGVYGEITEKGFRDLAQRLELNSDDSFFDLGSGVGKVVALAWLEYGCVLAKGIELDPLRHQLAVDAVAEVMTEYGKTCKLTAKELRRLAEYSISLVNADILASDLHEATVVWCANLCMSEEFDRMLARKLALLPNLRAIATLKDWPDGVEGFEQSCSAPERFEMSWTKEMGDAGGTVFIYTRKTR